MILLEFIYLFPDVQMTRRFKVFTLLALFSNIRPIIDVYPLVCVAPDRVAHCNSPLQFSCPKEISIYQICLINQYVKNRKLWGSPYAHHHWALKSSLKFLSTFSCLHCWTTWIKQAKICGNRVEAFVQYNTYCESKKYRATSLKLTLEWHCNLGHLSSSSRCRWMYGGEWRLPAELY